MSTFPNTARLRKRRFMLQFHLRERLCRSNYVLRICSSPHRDPIQFPLYLHPRSKYHLHVVRVLFVICYCSYPRAFSFHCCVSKRCCKDVSSMTTTAIATISDQAVISSYNRGPILTPYTAPTSCTATPTFGEGMYVGHWGSGYLDQACYPSSTQAADAALTLWDIYYCICSKGLWVQTDADIDQILRRFARTRGRL